MKKSMKFAAMVALTIATVVSTKSVSAATDENYVQPKARVETVEHTFVRTEWWYAESLTPTSVITDRTYRQITYMNGIQKTGENFVESKSISPIEFLNGARTRAKYENVYRTW